MTSQFTYYTSADVGAPQLTENAGTMLTVLDAVLVNGYGAKAAAGWSIAYTDTNKRVYQQGANSSGCYYRIDDSAAAGTSSRVWAAETMLDIDTAASGRFPTELQVAGGLYAYRASAGAGNRAWAVLADSQTCHFMWLPADPTLNVHMLLFGDYLSAVPNMPYRGMLIAARTANSLSNPAFWSGNAVANAGPTFGGWVSPTTAHSSTYADSYLQRGLDGVSTAVTVTHPAPQTTAQSFAINRLWRLPAPIDCHCQIWPIPQFTSNRFTWCRTSPGQPLLPGSFAGCTFILNDATTLNAGATFSGSGLFAGREFLVFSHYIGTNAVGFAGETSATVESNA